MAITDDTRRVIRGISKIYDRKKVALYALSVRTAADALRTFRRLQSQNTFWTNQTGEAARLVFADGFVDDDVVGWFMAHGIEYGVYLELANDGQHAALRPIVDSFSREYFKNAQALYRD